MAKVFIKMNATEELALLDGNLLLHNEGKWDSPYNPVSGYTSFNDAGVECEVGELLYGFVRALQPVRVLETGTHWGMGACYLALGLKHNKKGTLDTLEFLPEIYQVAVERFKRIGLTEYIHAYLIDAAKFEPAANYDLILLDTEPQTRFAELTHFIEHLNYGGFVFIHDLHRHLGQVENEEHGFAFPFGKVNDAMVYLVKNDILRPFHFNTPRGLTGFYKVHPDDYKW